MALKSKIKGIIMSRNDITGDKLISKNNNDNYNKNYDLIFSKKEDKKKEEEKQEYFKYKTNRSTRCQGR